MFDAVFYTAIHKCYESSENATNNKLIFAMPKSNCVFRNLLCSYYKHFCLDFIISDYIYYKMMNEDKDLCHEGQLFVAYQLQP